MLRAEVLNTLRRQAVAAHATIKRLTAKSSLRRATPCPGEEPLRLLSRIAKTVQLGKGTVLTAPLLQEDALDAEGRFARCCRA